MSREIIQQALNVIKNATHQIEAEWIYDYEDGREAIAALEAELAKPANEFHPDWDTLQPYHDRIAELEAQLAKPEQYLSGFWEWWQPYQVEDPIRLDHIARDAWVAGRQALARQDHGFDRTASHMAGEYVDTANQEPVAWMDKEDCGDMTFTLVKPTYDNDLIPLYTAPPRKPWVGLTEDEIANLWNSNKWDISGFVVPFTRAIEAKLREKNDTNQNAV